MLASLSFDVSFIILLFFENIGFSFVSFLSWTTEPLLEVKNRLQGPDLNSEVVVADTHGNEVEQDVSPQQTKVSPSLIPTDTKGLNNLIFVVVWTVVTNISGAWILNVTLVISGIWAQELTTRLAFWWCDLQELGW